MKKYAFYLPQFHEIKENNEWWGEGFTEWVNVKKAKPLFKNHQQPVHPLDSNYYDLSDKKTLMWQAKLANDYDIDGMIFYHYYFCGKLLLEKPSEMLLDEKNIPMNFFFCWANHSWFRSWDGSKTLLMEQTYGDENDWESHFQYLLRFFNDERYQKKNNKPLIMIYNPEFEEKNLIFDYFNKRCKDYGYDGILVIDTVTSLEQYNRISHESTSYERFLHLREPTFSLDLQRNSRGIFSRAVIKAISIIKYGLFVVNGDRLLSYRDRYKMNASDIPGLAFGWDNSPRHGKRSFIITPISRDVFLNYMESIKNNDYVFINAWNEWAEGMMLEPTEENGYKYLEWIKEWSENDN